MGQSIDTGTLLALFGVGMAAFGVLGFIFYFYEKLNNEILRKKIFRRETRIKELSEKISKIERR